MSVGIQMDYDGLVFNSGTADADGTQWYVDQYDGWDNPATRVTSSTPTTRHGQVPARVLFDARAIVLGGIVKATSVPNFYKAYYGIDLKFNNLITPKNLTVNEDVDRYVAACRMGSIKKTLQGGCAFTWQINLTCPDPFKYGAEVTTTITAGTSATLTNDGNFPTERIVVTTGAGNISVLNETVGGRGLINDDPVTTGSVFDFYFRGAEDASGNTYFPLAPYAEWFTLQPGDNTVTNHSDDDVSVTFRPAWI